MTKVETLEQVKLVCRMRRLSRHTEDTYAGWIARFVDHVRTCAQAEREERVRMFLEKLAARSAASTQNQALHERKIVAFEQPEPGKGVRAPFPQVA